MSLARIDNSGTVAGVLDFMPEDAKKNIENLMYMGAGVVTLGLTITGVIYTWKIPVVKYLVPATGLTLSAILFITGLSGDKPVTGETDDIPWYSKLSWGVKDLFGLHDQYHSDIGAQSIEGDENFKANFSAASRSRQESWLQSLRYDASNLPDADMRAAAARRVAQAESIMRY